MDHHINLVLKAAQSRTDIVKSFNTIPLVWDLGASVGLTPCHASFFGYVECDIDVKDIFKLNKVVSFGTTLHKSTATNGDQFYVTAISYHQLSLAL